MNDLKDLLIQEQKKGFPFMESREPRKIKDFVGYVVTITNVDLMTDVLDKLSGGYKDLIVFTIAEDEKHFFFGGNAITNMFVDFFNKFGKENIQHLAHRGELTVKVVKKVSKKFNSEYITLEVC